jgi:dynein heavy chain
MRAEAGFVNRPQVVSKFPVSYDESLNTVLRLELSRFNRLLAAVRTTLTQLQQALKGEIVMSVEMEEAYECVHQVPTEA